MYSLPNPSESERPFSPLEEPVLRALGRRGGRGAERNWTDSYALKERKKERIFISQPQHDRYYCTWFITNIVNSYLHQREKNTSSYYLQTRLGWEGRHVIGRGGHRIQRPDIIGSGQLALGWWVRWGGGMGTGSEREGVAYFLPQTSADIYHIGVFQKYAFWA